MAEKKITIRELIETGKRNGKLTTKEINDAIEETGFDVEQIDKLYETLEGHNVEIVDEPDADSENFTLTENSVDMFENALSAEGVAIDDPVKVYLKEIGRVPPVSYTHLDVYKRQVCWWPPIEGCDGRMYQAWPP